MGGEDYGRYENAEDAMAVCRFILERERITARLARRFKSEILGVRLALAKRAVSGG